MTVGRKHISEEIMTDICVDPASLAALARLLGGSLDWVADNQAALTSWDGDITFWRFDALNEWFCRLSGMTA